MTSKFLTALALLGIAGILFAAQRRLLNRHERQRVPLQCPDCREVYAIVRWEQVGPAVALHSEFQCPHAELRYYG